MKTEDPAATLTKEGPDAEGLPGSACLISRHISWGTAWRDRACKAQYRDPEVTTGPFREVWHLRIPRLGVSEAIWSWVLSVPSHETLQFFLSPPVC